MRKGRREEKARKIRRERGSKTSVTLDITCTYLQSYFLDIHETVL